MTSMNATDSAAQLMIVPGGTTPGAVTMTYSAAHKLWELYERFEKTGVQRSQRIILAPREANEAMPARAAQTNAALQKRIKKLPGSVDVILETSGSTTGNPRLVGLSFGALVASARATHEALGGPGRWIVALPVHHVAGLQTLIRTCVAEASPIIADMSAGFDEEALTVACRTGADDGDNRAYLSLVPKQLHDTLEAGGELVEQLARLDAVLVGGAGTSSNLLDRARAAGINVVTTYGMSETGGGCVYNDTPLPGVQIRTVDGRIQIAGPVLMDGYVDGFDRPFDVEDGQRWLRTSDAGEWDGHRLQVLGRADDVIVSGAVNVAPTRVADVIAAAKDVSDVAVVALPDEKWGQVVAAAIASPCIRAKIDEAGADLPAHENEVYAKFAKQIRDLVGEQLGRDHAPRVIAVVNELAVTPLGKVDRHAVGAMVANLVASEAAWVR